jgi:glucose-1-phosphate cytidylyltransferase
MKVVLFCGGLGLRIRSIESSAPKPMMSVGDRPILWHIMKYYAHFGHKDFILCLGYGAQVVKDYFLNYQETTSNDFVLTNGGREVELFGSDISDWRITFVDTGLETQIGERLRRVRDHLDGDELFLANYGDVLTDAPMNDIIAAASAADVAGSMLVVKPQESFHAVNVDEANRVRGIQSAAELPIWINGGHFVLRQEIFDYLNEGEDLVMDGCRRAAERGRLLAIPHEGFWAPMDTLKERAMLEGMLSDGTSPWTLWGRAPARDRRHEGIDTAEIAGRG